MTRVPYVHSGYERIEDDNYQTIDDRCMTALLDCWDIDGKIVDCCAPSGSGIIDFLQSKNMNAHCISDAFSKFKADWIITNPPYKLNIVDHIAVECQIKLELEEVNNIAFLMRANWDFAKSRWPLFDNDFYSGQVRMRFRPWWSEERTAQPIHNFVWHIWQRDPVFREPIIRYWPWKPN